MMLWILIAALLTQLITGLPIATLVVDSAKVDDGDDLSFELLNNVTDSPAFVSHDTNISPRSRIVKRTSWLWDPPGYDNSHPDIPLLLNPERYNYNSFARRHNKIPPGLLTGPGPDAKGRRTKALASRFYTQEEIYTAFRAGALLLMDIMSHPDTADDEYVPYNGQRFPQEDRGPNRATRVRIGLGTWYSHRAQQDLPVEQRTTAVYEYLLIAGGNYPSVNMGLGNVRVNNPGPDRVLFQLMRCLPIFLGVVSQRDNIVRRPQGENRDV
ncbi:uncharacterized protein PG986_000473 [Apiospora aurea]|uniref:Uncharacterized protein n=1 Tax=Apiospora aurea TaxID=335848 RepID=A0ABR1QV56_9PEZI